MKKKKLSRVKFWLTVLIGYVVIFAIGFAIPIVYDAVSNKDSQDTAIASSSSSSSEPESSSSSSKPKKEATSKKTQEHKKSTSTAKKVVVEAGETAYAIANKYGLTVDELQELNDDIDLDNLQEGQKIAIAE